LSRIAEPALLRSALESLRLQMELLDERRFGSGVVHLHYGVAPGG
jgi:hypothetical protein